MTTIIFQAGCVIFLMGRATNGSCHPSVPQRATCFKCRTVPPNGLEQRPKYDPLDRAVPGTAHASSARAVLGPGQILHAMC
jgi:hypothetical protein